MFKYSYSTLPLLLIGAMFTPVATATTTSTGSIFTIDEGVAFGVGNVGASNFTFTWTDPNGGSTFTDQVDPTLILSAGETYTFARTSSAHPFVIMDSSAASFITGTDGGYSRTTTDGDLITAATLQPIADFTADPSPSGDVITWTPSVGDYWYTCGVTGHTGMTGRIEVVPEPASLGTLGVLAMGSVVMIRRRWRRCRVI